MTADLADMPRSRTFQGPDGPFHYLDFGGTGPLVHLAHATGFCAGIYAPWVARLGPGLQVLALDDRGHGQTRAPADPRTLEDWTVFADDLARFFESLGEPVVAMGHSRGAVASLMVAARRPALVRALILIDPTILPWSWMKLWFFVQRLGLTPRVPIVRRAAARQADWPDRETLVAAYRDKPTFARWAPGFLEAYARWGAAEAAAGGVTLCCAPAWESRCFASCNHDVWRYVDRISQPTLVLYGARSDTFRPQSAARFAARVPHARLHRLEDTGHFVPMERPAEAAAAVLDFVRTL